MIAIGIQMGGPEQKSLAIRNALLMAARIAIRERDPDYDSNREGWINPIFVVPGSVSKPDFTGVEIGKFSASRNGLVIKISVPDSVVAGENVTQFLISALRSAVELASEYFQKHGIVFSVMKSERLIRSIKSRLERDQSFTTRA
jgi:hypothetical protein